MNIGIRERPRIGNAPISLLPVDKGGSAAPHSKRTPGYLGGVAPLAAGKDGPICNKTGGESAVLGDYQRGILIPSL
jgi:hypothetical protein